MLRYINKITAAVVSAALCLGSSFVFAADTAATVSDVGAEQYITDESLADKINLFKALGAYKQDVSQNPDRKITRGEFAGCAAALIGVQGGSVCAEDVFWDVSADNDYYSGICAALAAGIIHGSADSSFSPYEYIRETDAQRIMLGCIGYTEYIRARGNNDAAVNTAARKVRMSFSSDAVPLTFERMTELLYDSADICVAEDESYSPNELTFGASDRKLLEVWREIYLVKGVVNTSSVTSINGSAFHDGMITVGDTLIGGADVRANSCLGYNVDCFAEKSGGSYKYIYALKNNRNSVKTVDLKDITDVRYDKITYDSGSGKKTVSLSGKEKYIANGVAVDFSKADFDDIYKAKSGRVMFVSNDGGSGCNVVIAEIYKTLAVKYADLENDMIYDKNSAKYNVDLSDCEKYEILYSDTAQEEVLPGNTATLMMSFDKTYARLVVSDKTAVGTISAVSSDGNIRIDGKYYELTDELSESVPGGVVKPGTNAAFGLDAFGRVSYIDVSAADSTLLLGFAVGLKGKGAFAESVQMKIFVKSGDYETREFADSARIDGKSRSGSNIYDALGADAFTPTAIAYRLDDSGKIVYADTCVRGDNEDENTLFKRYDGTTNAQLFFKGSSNVNYRFVFGGKYISGNDDLLIMIDDKNDWNNLSPVLSLTDDTTYSVDVYSLGNDTPFGNIVLVRGTSATAVTKYAYLFSSVAREVDPSEKKDSLLRINCYNNASEASFIVAPEHENLLEGSNMISENSRTNLTPEQIEACSGMRAGDLFRVGLDAKGYVCVLEKLYDYKNGIFLNTAANASLKNASSAFEANATTRLFVGNVYSMKDGYARYSLDDIDLSDPLLESKLESIYAAGNMYTVDDKDNITITKITGGEQILGKKYGEDIKIFVRAEYTRPQSVYFIKNNN